VATQAELAAGDEPFVGYDSIPLNRGHILTDATPLKWLQLWDVANAEAVWAPLRTVGISSMPRGEPSGIMVSSNGLASGSHVLEAMLSGLMEVIERDAITLGYVTDTMRPVTTDGPASTWAALSEQIAAAGLVLTVSDCTADDVGVPTYHARLDDPGGGVGSFAGYGAALGSEVAVVRAITEAVQSRCIIVAGARDDVHRLQRRGAVRLAKRPPPPVTAPVSGQHRPVDLSGRSLVEDLTTAVSLLRRAGLHRVLVHRYSTEGDPVQVVRVLVPGLEGYRFRTYTPGARARERLAAMEGAP
jgi:ribosomal protein S12 methylthiotransferase accessory factor